MARSVTVGAGRNNVLLPNGGTYKAGDVVTLTDAQFEQLSKSTFANGTLVDNGPVGDASDAVVAQAAAVAAPPALTSAQAAAAPTQAQFNALQTDVANLRTTVANTLAALKGAGKPMVP